MIFDFNSVVDSILIFKDIDEISSIFFSLKKKTVVAVISFAHRSIRSESDSEVLRTKCRPFEFTKRVLRRQVFAREKKKKKKKGRGEGGKNKRKREKGTRGKQ